ncbi:MAG: NAD-dependent DNA ligase LigA, partial [Gammaproteobacteria bacterium]|nr:NAD-dependent DNA ligase LigA [Gammaproteobacteria bacterium]
MPVPEKTKANSKMLRDEINRHNHNYYVLDDPQITDQAYDELLRSLQKLEAQYPELVSSDSPTQRVGAAPATHFESVQHEVPMLSLDNAFDVIEMQAFEKRLKDKLSIESTLLNYNAEPKLDG